MNHLSSEQARAAIEALLFLHGEPFSNTKIEAVLEIKNDEMLSVSESLKHELEASGRCLQIVSDREKIQLATKPEFNAILENFVKEEISEDLTPASLEALAIVAYLGPISRAKIEYLRGVNSIVILRSLMIRGLIERSPDPEHPAIFLYRATFDLVKHLGVKGNEELPDYEKFQELLKVCESKNAQGEAAPSGTATPAA